MSALLEQHPHSQSKEVKCFSKRFDTLQKFLEQAVSVVPIESLLFAIVHSNDISISHQCCTHLMNLPFTFPLSLLSLDGYRAASEFLVTRYQTKVIDFKRDLRKDYEAAIGKKVFKKLDKLYEKEITPVERAGGIKQLLVLPFPSNISDEQRLRQILLTTYGTAPSDDIMKQCTYLARTSSMMSKDHNTNPTVLDAISSLDLSFVYNIQSKPDSDTAFSLKPPLNILIEGRKKLSVLSKQALKTSAHEASSDIPLRLSHLYNSRMLEIVNKFRTEEVRVSCLLLGAFMEEQVKVPLMKTSLDTAKALNVALSVAAVGVWAIFSLALGDLQAVIDSIPSRSLLVEVTDYIKGMFKSAGKIADPNYAGKLQFMVQGMKETVSCNSHYVSYSLERQLIELCKKLNIDESTPLDTLVGDWDKIFKDDILSMVVFTHRSLIARWLKWALMVHHLREELARYTAVGVVGLVNSGKSLLVSTLFDIDVSIMMKSLHSTDSSHSYCRFQWVQQPSNVLQCLSCTI